MNRRGSGEGAIYKSPDGRWRGAVDLGRKPDGTRNRKLVSGRTRNEVAGKLRELRKDIDQGVNPDARMTVGDWMGRYVETVIAGRVGDDKTLEQYERMLRVHIRPALGAVRVAELTPEQVDDFLAARSHLAKAYVGRMRSFLIAGLDHALKRGKVARNVAALSEMPKCKERVERQPMTPEQVAAFERAARGERIEALFVVAFDCGLRPGEMTGITWADLDLDGRPPTLSLSGAIHLKPRRRTDEPGDGESVYRGYDVVRGKVKKSTNPNRVVELSPAAVDALKAHRARQSAERLAAGPLWTDHGLVFCSEIGTPIDPANLRRVFSRIAKKAGIGHVFPYAIRHTTASLLIDAGASVEEVADLFGDDPVTLYRHYRHRVRKVASAGTRMRELLGAER